MPLPVFIFDSVKEVCPVFRQIQKQYTEDYFSLEHFLIIF